MGKYLLILLVGLLLGACTPPTMKADYNYGADDKQGMIALSALSKVMARVSFQRVDLENKKFVGDPIIFSNCTICIPGANTRTIEDKEASLNFQYQTLLIPPGQYAVTVTYDKEYDFGKVWQLTKETRTLTCFGLGTEVFEVKAGKINFIRFHDFAVFSYEEDVEEFVGYLKSNLKKYPNITAEVHVAEILGYIGFMKTTDDPRSCGDRSSDGQPFWRVEAPVF